MPSLMLAALCILMEKFLAILGSATATHEAESELVFFKTLEELDADEMHGRSLIHDRDDTADQSPPNFMPLISTL